MPWWHVVLMVAFAFAFVRGLVHDRLQLPGWPTAAIIAATVGAVMAYLAAIRPDHWPPWAIGIGILALSAMWWPNRSNPWLTVLLTGATLNLTVIAANGGAMPIAVPYGTPLPRHYVLMDGATRLPWLGDYIYIRTVQLLVAPGDLVMLAGILAFTTVQYWHEIVLLVGTKKPR